MSQPLPEPLIDRRTKIIARASEAARRLVEVSELLEVDLAACPCWQENAPKPCMACREIMKADRAIGKAVRALVGHAGRMQIENEMAAAIEASIAQCQADAPGIYPHGGQ